MSSRAHRRRRRALLAVTIACLTLPVAGNAGVTELWRAPAEADCRLELVNERGGVRLVAAPTLSSDVVVLGPPHARITGGSDAEGSIALAVHPAEADAGGPTGDRPADVEIDVEIDVELQVPRRCETTVRSADGAVSVEVGGGGFTASVGTVTGDITAWLDGESTASVSFATSGEITTDYTVEIEHLYHQEPSKRGRLESGAGPAHGGAADLRLTSRRGAVRLLRTASAPDRSQTHSTNESSRLDRVETSDVDG